MLIAFPRESPEAFGDLAGIPSQGDPDVPQRLSVKPFRPPGLGRCDGPRGVLLDLTDRAGEPEAAQA